MELEREVNLTDRESEILELVAQGLSNKINANKLAISEGAVKVDVKHLLKKTESSLASGGGGLGAVESVDFGGNRVLR